MSFENLTKFEMYLRGLEINIDFEKLKQWDKLIIHHIEEDEIIDGEIDFKISFGLLSGWTTGGDNGEVKVELCLVTNKDFSDCDGEEFIESCLITKIIRIDDETREFEEI